MEQYSIICVSSHQLMDIQVAAVLGCCVCAWTYIFIYLHQILSEIARLFGKCVFNLRSYQAVFHLPFPPEMFEFLVSLYGHQYLSVFWVLVILVGVQWYLIVAQNCISTMNDSVEHLFMCSLAICVSLVKCLKSSLPICKLGCLKSRRDPSILASLLPSFLHSFVFQIQVLYDLQVFCPNLWLFS